MQFSQPIIDIIRSRSSCRTYNSKLLPEKVRICLIDFLKENKSDPFGGTARFELIEMAELEPGERKQLGTYGFIQDARYFIAGAMKESSHGFENYGYQLETIILLATDIGLGTCWLGGTFKRSAFGERINTTEDEIAPAIASIGYPAEPRLAEKVVKWSVKSRKRLPWSSLFFEETVDSPLTEKQAGKYALPLEMVRLGPSSANGQPWRVIKERETKEFHFFIRSKKKRISGIRNLLAYPNLTRIDVGIAMCHFDLTRRELGLKGTWSFRGQDMNYPDSFQYIATWIGQ
ncbi:MAG: nitroreductase family protein [Candidatus Odinarchaeota archaeon]